MKRSCDIEDEAKAVDFLARVVLQSRAKIGPIGFIHYKEPKPAPKPKPSSARLKLK